jgi:hypothetical protein
MRIFASTAVLATIVLAAGWAQQGEPLTASPSLTVLAGQGPVRVGVYDNRGILLAWFASKYNDLALADLGKEYEQAKLAGDDERVKELEAMGPKIQRRLHFQGFGRAPVTEQLAHIEDQLPALAKELGIDVIAFECNYLGPDVEKIDITLDLVKLYDPSPETMKMVREIMDQDPIALEELTNDDH